MLCVNMSERVQLIIYNRGGGRNEVTGQFEIVEAGFNDELLPLCIVHNKYRELV